MRTNSLIAVACLMASALSFLASPRRRAGRAPRRIGLRPGTHACLLPAGLAAEGRLRRAGSGSHPRSRAHLPARRVARADDQRRRAVSRSGAVDPATGRKQWLAVDFTLAEIKRLDAGSWFDARFAGERDPDVGRGRGGGRYRGGPLPGVEDTGALSRARHRPDGAVRRVGEAARPSQRSAAPSSCSRSTSSRSRI